MSFTMPLFVSTFRPLPRSRVSAGNEIDPPPRPDRFTDAAMSYLVALGDAANDMIPPTIAVGEIETPSRPAFTTVGPPSLDTIEWTLPGFPAAFNENLDVDNLLPEPFDQNPPQLVFPTAPVPGFGDVPAAPGVNLPSVDPQLNLDLPDPPQLLNINVSKFDGIQLPEIDADAPEFTIVAPTIREYVPGAGYTSGLLSALEAELQDRIENGGTGLPLDAENAIWDRAREREYKQANDALLELERMEEMGYHMPPGVYMDGRVKIQTELGKNIAGQSREVMIEQARLEQSNIQQALTVAQTVEAKNLDINNAMEQRSFESARFATEAGVSIYNGKVRAFGAMVEAFRAKIAIYDAQVRAELGRVEAFKAEIDAEQTKAQINQARVDQFRVLTDAALSRVEVFKAEIDGIRTKAEIERLKIEIFGEQVRAHGNEVNAYTAQVEGFRAAIGAEASKQDAFNSAVSAYGAQVDASSKAIDARVSEFTAKLRAKESEWQGFTAQAQVESDRVRAMSAKNESVARMFQAEASASASFNDVLSKQWEASTQLSINTANVALEEAKANAELFVTKRSMITEAAKVGATVTAQLGAAAISANNFSTSNSRSKSESATKSRSTSNSFSSARSWSKVDQTIRNT